MNSNQSIYKNVCLLKVLNDPLSYVSFLGEVSMEESRVRAFAWSNPHDSMAMSTTAIAWPGKSLSKVARTNTK